MLTHMQTDTTGAKWETSTQGGVRQFQRITTLTSHTHCSLLLEAVVESGQLEPVPTVNIFILRMREGEDVWSKDGGLWGGGGR